MGHGLPFLQYRAAALRPSDGDGLRSLIATALFSLVPLLWQKAEKVEKADVRKLIGAALLIGVLRKVFIMYGLSMTSPIDGSIIDTIVPLLVLLLSVLLGMGSLHEAQGRGAAARAWRAPWQWC